jgi:hypothetical protein
VGYAEEKRALGWYRRRWEDNIKTCLREIGYKIVVWMELAQDRLQWRAILNKVMNLWVQ